MERREARAEVQVGQWRGVKTRWDVARIGSRLGAPTMSQLYIGTHSLSQLYIGSHSLSQL